MSIFKKINEAVKESPWTKGAEAAKFMQEFRRKIFAHHKIKTSDEAIHAFFYGGDAPNFKKLVDALGDAGYNTAGGYAENRKFLKDLDISEELWDKIATLSEGAPFAAAEVVANEMLEGKVDEMISPAKFERLLKTMKTMITAGDATDIEDAAQAAIDDMETVGHEMSDADREELIDDLIHDFTVRAKKAKVNEDCGKKHMEDEESNLKKFIAFGVFDSHQNQTQQKREFMAADVRAAISIMDKRMKSIALQKKGSMEYSYTTRIQDENGKELWNRKNDSMKRKTTKKLEEAKRPEILDVMSDTVDRNSFKGKDEKDKVATMVKAIDHEFKKDIWSIEKEEWNKLSDKEKNDFAKKAVKTLAV